MPNDRCTMFMFETMKYVYLWSKDQKVICKPNAQVIFITKWFSILSYVIFSIDKKINKT